MEPNIQLDVDIIKGGGESPIEKIVSLELEELFSDSDTALQSFGGDLSNYNPQTVQMPLWVTTIEKSLKNYINKYSGNIPTSIASLYSSYLLVAMNWMETELSKMTFYAKQKDAELDYVMAEEKDFSKDKIEGKDSDKARESWVIKNSMKYRLARESKNKAVALHLYLQNRAKTLDKAFYFCKTILSGVDKNDIQF